MSFQVFTPKTENKVAIRTVDSNRIYAVYTPTNRMVYLIKQWEYKQFSAAIQNKSMALDESENGNYRSMHTKETYFEHFNSIPTTKAWSVLKEHILDNDEIWTFNSLDAGFVVIRDNHLYCMVITDHSV